MKRYNDSCCSINQTCFHLFLPKNFTKVESNTHIPEHPFKNCRQRALPRTLRKVTLVMEFDGQKPNYVFVVKTRIMIVLKLKGRQFSTQKVNSFWSLQLKAAKSFFVVVKNMAKKAH